MLSKVLGRRLLAVATTFALGSACLAACSSEPETPRAQASATSSVCAELTELTKEYGSFPAGTAVMVAVQRSWVGAQAMQASLERLSRCTGVDVEVVEVEDVVSALEQGDLQADLALLPEAGVLPSVVDQGLVRQVPQAVGANVELGWDRVWAEAGTVDGVLYAAPLTASLDSLVWYPPQTFTRLGYEVPQTWEQMLSLTTQVVDDFPDGDVAPWCLSLEGSEAEGSQLTGWLADALVQLSGPVAYDQWTSGEEPVDSADAVAALDALGTLLLTDGHVAGGRQAALTTTPQQAVEQLVDGQCLMLHAPSSLEALLTDGVVADGDLSAFPTPSGGRGEETASVASADFLVMVRSGQGADAVMSYLTSAQWAQAYAALRTGASAHHGVDAAATGSAVVQRASQVLQSRQSLLRLDSGELLPAEQMKALHQALAAWAAGDADAATALGRAETGLGTEPEADGEQ
ncbi:extracellular solute-binding protein [Actinomyces faecalis]|uniref:extracellular solute-binding protein n=1 Tax=Actinomyces faecalis TaxID=2722820 RepID=UPI0015528306|nr:extracellular solute-binding protein [Actinomyces faecalis]